MNARLSSLLIAGGVVLAGIQAGSLLAAPANLAPGVSPMANSASLESAVLTADGEGARILLRAPGYTARPGLQLLQSPLRVVVDLPGVQRGTRVSRKDLNDLKHPLIRKARLGQFETSPRPVTRLVLDVVPGTQATVSAVPDGLQILLVPGHGRAQAHLDGFDSVAPGVVPAKPLGTPELVTAKLAIPAPMPAVASATKSLAPLPSVGAGFQTLPSLAASTVLPAAAPEAIQAPESAPARQEPAAPNRYVSRTLGDDTPKYTGARITIDLQNTDIR
ncbi:MAG TPA: AMIN domain-containing protein, partial [Holophagaceae bacterium]